MQNCFTWKYISKRKMSKIYNKAKKNMHSNTEDTQIQWMRAIRYLWTLWAIRYLLNALKFCSFFVLTSSRTSSWSSSKSVTTAGSRKKPFKSFGLSPPHLNFPPFLRPSCSIFITLFCWSSDIYKKQYFVKKNAVNGNDFQYLQLIWKVFASNFKQIFIQQ